MPPQQATPVKRFSLSNIGTSAAAIRNRREGNHLHQQQAERTEESQQHSQFTNDMLKEKWIEVCQQVPGIDETNLKRLRSLNVEISEFPHIAITITNALIEKYLLKVKDGLENALAEGLKNSDLKIELRLATVEETQHSGMTHDEIYQELVRTNSSFAKLKEIFKLELYQ